MQSIVQSGYDAELVLQAPGETAITATTVSTKIAIDQILNSPRGALDGRYGEQEFEVIVHLDALVHTTNETYTLEFCTYDANGGTETVQESVVVTPAQQGRTLRFSLNPATFRAFDDSVPGTFTPTDAGQQFGLKAVLTGTAPSLSYWAFVSSDSD